MSQRVAAEVDATGLPSIQVAIGRGRDEVFETAAGFADLEHQVLATPQTLYRTASISKWLTGTAAFRLAERGALDLDAPVQQHCPEYPTKAWPVTARQLLSHTAGVRHYEDYDRLLAEAGGDAALESIERRRERAALSSYRAYDDVVSPLALFAADPLVDPPGTRFRYSSFGYRLLGCVLEGAAGRPYRQMMREEIFVPAGMSSIVEDDAREIIPHRARGYAWADGQPLRGASFRDVSENLPAGGHLATAGDLVAFAQAFASGRLVGAESRAQMAAQPVGSDGETIDSGYGHGVDRIGGFPGSLGHPGQQQGATTLLLLLPEEDLSIAVLTNASGWRGIKGLVGDLLEIVRQDR